MSKMQRQAISNSQKAALRAEHALKPHLSGIQLTNWFEKKYTRPISESSVCRILSSRFEFLDTIPAHRLGDKRRRTEQWPELEKVLYDWMKRAEGRISQVVVREKARFFWSRIYPDKDMPRFSNGWLRRFQSRNNIKCGTLHREEGTVSDSVAKDMVEIRQALRGYAPHDIFNCDESGLFWKLVPDCGLTIPGRKKARITAHFCCNADASERLPLWFIGTAKRPKAFSAAGINIENLGCFWRSNKEACMTSDIFKEWILWFDRRMTGRKVALLFDNYPAHKAAFDEVGLQLQNTLIIWLPANPMTRFQPLDQGIINTWKVYWKRQWVSYMLAEFDQGFDPLLTMTVLHAVRWAINIWSFDIPDDTIKKCFNKALTVDKIEEVNNQQLIKEIQVGLDHLHLSNYVNEIMTTDQFLNLPEEEVTNNMGIDSMVLRQFETTEDPEEDDDEEIVQPLPLISVPEALEGLYKLRLYEEQQVDGNKDFLHALMHQERKLMQRKSEDQHQSDIHAFFSLS